MMSGIECTVASVSSFNTRNTLGFQSKNDFGIVKEAIALCMLSI